MLGEEAFDGQLDGAISRPIETLHLRIGGIKLASLALTCISGMPFSLTIQRQNEGTGVGVFDSVPAHATKLYIWLVKTPRSVDQNDWIVY